MSEEWISSGGSEILGKIAKDEFDPEEFVEARSLVGEVITPEIIAVTIIRGKEQKYGVGLRLQVRNIKLIVVLPPKRSIELGEPLWNINEDQYVLSPEQLEKGQRVEIHGLFYRIFTYAKKKSEYTSELERLMGRQLRYYWIEAYEDGIRLPPKIKA